MDHNIHSLNIKCRKESLKEKFKLTGFCNKKISNNYSLSCTQERFWILNRLIPEISYNIVATFKIFGNLRYSEIGNSLNKAIESYPLFNSSFFSKNGVPEVRLRYSSISIEIKVNENDFSEIEQNNKILNRMIAHIERPFDLEKDPLFRIEIVKVNELESILILSSHQIVSDANTLWFLAETFIKAYEKDTSLNTDYSDCQRINYIEYVKRENQKMVTSKWKAALKFWKNELAGSSGLIHLPTDRPRLGMQKKHWQCERFDLPVALTQKLNRTVRSSKIPISVPLLAVWAILLSRYSGEKEVIIGTVLSNYEQLTDGFLSGPIANEIPYRLKIDNNVRFLEWCQKYVQKVVQCSLKYGTFPFAKLVEEIVPKGNFGVNPIFQVMFNFEEPMLDFVGKKLTLSTTKNCVMRGGELDINLSLKVHENVIVGRIEFDQNLFFRQTIKRIIGHFEQFLISLVKYPEKIICEVSMLSRSERNQLLYKNNETQFDFPEAVTLMDIFESIVCLNPDSVALIDEKNEISFEKLNQYSNRIAHYLRDLGLESNTCIGISMNRSIGLIATILGVLKSGNIYVPLDPSYPKERLKYIIRDSSIETILCDRASKAILENMASSINLILIDITDFNINLQSNTNLSECDPSGDNCYVIYTSGSTGRPKGIIGTTRGILNRLYWMWNEYPFATDEVCCQRTSVNFVDHVAELFGPLLQGVPSVIIDERKIKNVEGFIQVISKYSVTRVVLIPSLLGEILRLDTGNTLSRVKYWFCSGESMSIYLAQLFYKKYSGSQLFNVYGSTEVSADVAWTKVEPVELQSIVDSFIRTDDSRIAEVASLIENDYCITHPFVELEELIEFFKNTEIPEGPKSLEEYAKRLRREVLPFLVNTASPRFIGHMTSALPSYMHDISRLISQLNQNVVKIETSKSLTLLEREAVAMLHRAFFNLPKDFYCEHTQKHDSSLGLVVSGGTLANITALWCARNTVLGAAEKFGGIDRKGVQSALGFYGYFGMAVICSKMAHYSIKKGASILGIGIEQIIEVAQDESGKVSIEALKECIEESIAKKILIIAIVGIGGATETGCIDPLNEMAEVAHHFGIHFHVDAAWGGPVAFSRRHAYKLKGIEKADSITICGHKQFYLPMGISVCIFRSPYQLEAISVDANYQARKGGFDLGRISPEGSRPALSLSLHAGLNLIGRKGYEKLIDAGIEKAQYLVKCLLRNDAFELIGKPEINIVNYRYIPEVFRNKLAENKINDEDNAYINSLNKRIQIEQFNCGNSFVSRTHLSNTHYGLDQSIVVFRAVLANPLTTYEDIDFIISDQLRIAKQLLESNMNEALRDNEITYVNSGSSLINELAIGKELEETLKERTVPIGKPIGNTEIYILDSFLYPVSVGMTGEIHVAGEALAHGYINDPTLTMAKFIKNPFSSNPESRMFRTGDFGKWLPSGKIECLGRNDQQVKIGELRIECSDIETCMLDNDEVEEVIVLIIEEDNCRNLIAYYKVNEHKQLDIIDFKKRLRDKLPKEMIPDQFVRVDDIPRLPNGKKDRMYFKNKYKSIWREIVDM